MKKLLIYLLVLLTAITLTGCGLSATKTLTGDDLSAYNMMLEVCYVAKDPTKVSVISGSVTDTIGVFKVSYNDGEETYNVLVHEENGEYIVEKLYDSLAETYKDLLYKTDDFSARNVNVALQAYWNK